MVGDLRWWILSRRYRPLHEVERILQADSVTHLIGLAFRSRRLFVHLVVSLWIVVIIGSQVAVASLGLLYSVETAKTQALTVPGELLLSNMSSFDGDRVVSTKSEAIGAQQYVANSYGVVSTAYALDTLADMPPEGTLWTPGDPLLFCEDICVYAFHEISASSLEKYNAEPLSVITSRTINATVTCTASKVVKGGDGSASNITVATNDGDKVVFLPYAGGIDQTTFFVNTSRTCGPGCSEISAFEASPQAPWYYQCDVTVGQVANSSRIEHEASDEFRSIASGAIALQGYGASSLAENTDIQFQSYPAETVYGWPFGGRTNEMALVISRFTVGGIASAAERNEKIVIKGSEPQRGSHLNVSHPGFITLILVLVVVIQLVLDSVIQIWANRVVVPRGGTLAMAKVLRSMVSNQEDPGSYLRGSDPPKSESYDSSLWIYRYRALGNGFFDLYMEESRVPKQDHNHTQMGSVFRKATI
ncbi:hypothetical protein HJFPF1_04455 [Paramyrothecium foliicola]|nr:hypothetical protein HJFPF1_04455 [Paramyrothecium foliicola]